MGLANPKGGSSGQVRVHNVHRWLRSPEPGGEPDGLCGRTLMDGTNPDAVGVFFTGITAAQGRVSRNHHVNREGLDMTDNSRSVPAGVLQTIDSDKFKGHSTTSKPSDKIESPQ